MPDFKRKFSLPDFCAFREKPYGSRTLAPLPGVVHKVIHSFCAKSCATHAGSKTLALPHIYAQVNYSMESRTLIHINALAHNLIHKKCAKAPVGGKLLTETPWLQRESRDCRHKTARCLVFTQCKKAYKNQGALAQLPGLRTILSTKNVQKIGARRSGIA